MCQIILIKSNPLKKFFLSTINYENAQKSWQIAIPYKNKSKYLINYETCQKKHIK